MPYLSFDLDGKKRAARVARAVGVDPGVVAWGLLELWEQTWASKEVVASEMVLDGCFGPNPRMREALVAYDFLQSVDGGWRVKGAARYLGISESRVGGGKARVASAARDSKGRMVAASCPAPVQHEAPEVPDVQQPPAPVQHMLDTHPAPDQLLHPTPNTQHPRKKPAGEKPAKSSAPVAPGWQALADTLFERFKAHRGQVPSPTSKDWKHLKMLRERVKSADPEIILRWDRGLRAQFKQRVDSFADLNQRWDSLTGTDPPTRAGGARFVNAQDADKNAFAKTGTLDDF